MIKWFSKWFSKWFNYDSMEKQLAKEAQNLLAKELLSKGEIIIRNAECKVTRIFSQGGKLYVEVPAETEEIVRLIKQEADYMARESEVLQRAKLNQLLKVDNKQDDNFELLGA